MTHDSLHGVYGLDYYEGRKADRALIYRLRRRTDEVERVLLRHSDGPLRTIIDLGTADGLMIDDLRHRLGQINFVGVEMNRDLLRAVPESQTWKVQADVQNLPLRNSIADALVATAVIEHLPHPSMLLDECHRVLRPGGLLVITTPDPLMERFASKVGLLKDAGHDTTFTIRRLRNMLSSAVFDVVESRKFMFSPIGFPAEKLIERIFGPLGLKLIMANQLVVGRRA
ncbi:class I SAM-dependent methyltransferase [Dehalococcoidia bacterium]|nr:class I SAM-dependent methyltransferase [Dehalococcoidia bacterium]